MNTLIIGALAALLSFAFGLILGAAVGGGARADQDFQEYTKTRRDE